MIEPLELRATERKIYELVVEMIVDVVAKEFPFEEESRLRIYDLIANNFSGMVKVLRSPEPSKLIERIENG